MAAKEKNTSKHSQSLEQNGITKRLKIIVAEPREAYELLPYSEIIFSSEALGSMHSTSPSEAEESTFELLRDLAEAFPELHSTVIINIGVSPSDPEEHELIKAKIRAVFRSAIYGDFALFCEGVQNSSDYDRFCKAISEAFCELEAENREFNGYIPKGVLISTPLSMMNLCSCSTDLLCIDLDKIIPLITGNSEQVIDLLPEDTFASVLKILSESFEKFQKCTAVLSSSLSSSLCQLAEVCGAQEIWIRKQKSTNL